MVVFREDVCVVKDGSSEVFRGVFGGLTLEQVASGGLGGGELWCSVNAGRVQCSGRDSGRMAGHVEGRKREELQ